MNQTIPQIDLIAHGHTLSTAPTRLGWLNPSDPATPIDDLRAQYRAQGYLWLKGLIPPEKVWQFRERYFEAFRDTGLLKPGTAAVDGIAADHVATNPPQLRERDAEIARWTVYEAFCLLPEIIDFYEVFLGGRTYLHKRKLIRWTAPGSDKTTPAHYDLVYLRGGTDKSLCTSWIPIGDTPVEMGGLIYLDGSDTAGREIEAEFRVKNADLPPDEQLSAYNRNMGEGGWLTNDLPALADKLDSRWLIANYETGDMVVHSPYMIHASTMNQRPDGRMRLSTDIRYQLADDKIDQRWASDWYPGDNL
jgi:ectoine hydroxylase-related dioxygenase (phytanoyl-CoA dioxygenase family)